MDNNYYDFDELNDIEDLNSNTRTRAYRRQMRQKHIKRKKRICNNHMVFPVLPDGTLDFTREIPLDWYEHDGQYSKGKIYCNCGICKYSKKYGLPTYKEMKDAEYVKQAIQEMYTA